MAANDLPREPRQMRLLPEAIPDGLPEGRLATSATRRARWTRTLSGRYDKDGPRNQPFHLAMMVKVLVYGDAAGVFTCPGSTT